MYEFWFNKNVIQYIIFSIKNKITTNYKSKFSVIMIFIIKIGIPSKSYFT